MLFHYHFWTPFVEETEKFYENNGFRISQRIGKYQGDFQMFNPPLKWDDFRDDTKEEMVHLTKFKIGG
ncbi:hypothetical protein GCM10007199_40060 [Fictibacillus barbaricus]|nr:hypothetical protein GCM10007199_40060 [Fictibacillus barbaricus]